MRLPAAQIALQTAGATPGSPIPPKGCPLRVRCVSNTGPGDPGDTVAAVALFGTRRPDPAPRERVNHAADVAFAALAGPCSLPVPPRPGSFRRKAVLRRPDQPPKPEQFDAGILREAGAAEAVAARVDKGRVSHQRVAVVGDDGPARASDGKASQSGRRIPRRPQLRSEGRAVLALGDRLTA